MKRILGIILVVIVCQMASAQLVAVVQLKEPVPGICNQKEVYALYSGFTGQVEAKCPSSKDEILKRLNSEVKFLEDNPKFKGKGMVGIMINCKGKVVQCMMDNTTKNKELDAQIVAVFNSLGEWRPGTMEGKEVDSHQIFSFKIKKGQIAFD